MSTTTDPREAGAANRCGPHKKRTLRTWRRYTRALTRRARCWVWHRRARTAASPAGRLRGFPAHGLPPAALPPSDWSSCDLFFNFLPHEPATLHRGRCVEYDCSGEYSRRLDADSGGKRQREGQRGAGASAGAGRDSDRRAQAARRGRAGRPSVRAAADLRGARRGCRRSATSRARGGTPRGRPAALHRAAMVPRRSMRQLQPLRPREARSRALRSRRSARPRKPRVTRARCPRLPDPSWSSCPRQCAACSASTMRRRCPLPAARSWLCPRGWEGVQFPARRSGCFRFPAGRAALPSPPPLHRPSAAF